jgi:hypothetical protein
MEIKKRIVLLKGKWTEFQPSIMKTAK